MIMEQDKEEEDEKSEDGIKLRRINCRANCSYHQPKLCRPKHVHPSPVFFILSLPQTNVCTQPEHSRTIFERMTREQDEEEEDEKSGDGEVKEEKDGSEGSLEWPKKAKTEPHPNFVATCGAEVEPRFLPQNALEGFVPFGTHVQVRIQISRVAALDAASKVLQNLSYESGLPHLAISNHVSLGAWMLFYYQKAVTLFEQYSISVVDQEKMPLELGLLMDDEKKRKRKSTEDDVSWYCCIFIACRDTCCDTCLISGMVCRSMLQLALYCTLLHDAGIPTQSNATHVFDRFIGTHPTDMRVNEDLCFTSAIDKNGARPPSVNCADTQNAAIHGGSHIMLSPPTAVLMLHLPSFNYAWLHLVTPDLVIPADTFLFVVVAGSWRVKSTRILAGQHRIVLAAMAVIVGYEHSMTWPGYLSGCWIMVGKIDPYLGGAAPRSACSHGGSNALLTCLAKDMLK
ncbi:hypothetical protein Tco_0270056 [Tanacetum coccineum]